MLGNLEVNLDMNQSALRASDREVIGLTPGLVATKYLLLGWMTADS